MSTSEENGIWEAHVAPAALCISSTQVAGKFKLWVVCCILHEYGEAVGGSEVVPMVAFGLLEEESNDVDRQGAVGAKGIVVISIQ